MSFLVQLKSNSVIAERHFCTKLTPNLISAIEISQHNANTAFFAILFRKKVNNLLKKVEIYQCYDLNGTSLISMYKIALLTAKKFESAAQ